MYVKVTGDAKHGSSLWETVGPVHSGLYGVPFTDSDDQGPVFDFAEGLPFVPNLLNMREITVDNRTEYERGEDLVTVRFAWWFTTEDSVGVVTTRNIFIMSGEGHTVDKV